MRSVLLLASLGLGIVAASSHAQAACNVRGEFCGYPAWAANAFTHPRDRVPDAWLEPPVRKTYRANKTYRVTQYRKRYRR
ncbi:MAG: hypothetical protein ACKVP3_05430 [Hyphomicrobiaceae bacterium]